MKNTIYFALVVSLPFWVFVIGLLKGGITIQPANEVLIKNVYCPRLETDLLGDNYHRCLTESIKLTGANCNEDDRCTLFATYP